MRGILLVLRASVQTSPWQTLACLGEAAGKALRAAAPLFYALLVDGLLQQNLITMLVAVAALVGTTGINMLLQAIGSSARVTQMERVGFAFDTRIAEITSRIPTVDHLDSATYLDELQTLRQQEGALGGAFNTIISVFANLVFAAVTLSVALSADWRLLLVAVLGIPGIALSRWIAKWNRQAEDAAGAPGRLANHLVGMLADPVSGAELRVFGLRNEIRHRIGRAVDRWRTPNVRLMQRISVAQLPLTLLFFGGAIVVLVLMARDVMAGQLGVGAVVIGVSAIGGLQSVSSTIASSIQAIAQVIRTASRFLWLTDYADRVEHDHQGTVDPTSHDSVGIELRSLHFRYDGAERDTLHDISLTIPAGSVVALVGENGAGKTTLVNLLAGFHRPTGGEILVDGLPLSDLNIRCWRQRMAGAFQDYVTFEFTVLESVGVGDLEHLDAPTVGRALEGVPATGLLEVLPDGLRTQLGTSWPGGVDLSGGQRQRLAIARGLMRPSPLLLLLDEPTAALDPTAEDALCERYARAARSSRRRGGITVMVTHRFSTVASADLIIVLEKGQVTEVGNHAELLQRGGQYAELYELQARGYR